MDPRSTGNLLYSRTLTTDSFASPPCPSPPAPLSFETVYGEYFPFVWRVARALGGPSTSLDDAVQDVFVIVLRRLHEFRGDSSVRSWIFGIVRNVTANHRRSAKRQSRYEPLDNEPMSLSPGPLERVQELESAEFVAGFLSRLETSRRELFVLVMLEQMSMPEVARALDVPLNTAYTRLHRLRAEFRKALERRQRKGSRA